MENSNWPKGLGIFLVITAVIGGYFAGAQFPSLSQYGRPTHNWTMSINVFLGGLGTALIFLAIGAVVDRQNKLLKLMQGEPIEKEEVKEVVDTKPFERTGYNPGE